MSRARSKSPHRYRRLGLRRTVSGLLRANLHELLWQEWSRQGDVAYFRIGSYDMILLSDPVDVKHVLQDVPERYGKKLPTMQKLLGDGISNAEGAHWRKHRLHLKGSFSHRELGSYFPLTLRSTERIVDSLSRDGYCRIDLEAMATAVTQRVIFDALFGEHYTGDRQGFTDRFNTLVSNQVWLALMPEFMAAWPTLWARAFHRAMNGIDRFVMAQIRATPRRETGHDTILAHMMRARDADGAFLFSEQEVRDDIVSLMLAGYETTAATLCWALALISSHPDVHARLRDESRWLTGRERLAYTDLAHFQYGRAVINEVLRLYPPGWSMRRIAMTEDELPSGASISPSDFIVIAPYILQRHPAHWSHPGEFRPERFMDAGDIRRKGYAFMPFGGGPRRCLGMNFAYMELLTVLLTMLKKGAWHMSHPVSLPIHSRGTMKPAIPLYLHWMPNPKAVEA